MTTKIGYYEKLLLDDLNSLARVQVLLRQGSEARELVTKRIVVLINALRDYGVVLEETTELHEFAWSLVFEVVDVDAHLFVVNKLHEIVRRNYMPASVQDAALNELVKEQDYLATLGIEVTIKPDGLHSWRDLRGQPNENMYDYEQEYRREHCEYCGNCGHRTSDDDLPPVGGRMATELNGNPSL